MARQDFSRFVMVMLPAILSLQLFTLACKGRDGDLSGLRETRAENLSPQSAVSVEPPFNFAAMRALIETQKIRTIDDLLPALPDEFVSNVILMTDSRSTQEATSWAPRAILRNNASTFVMAFNGDDNQAGYRNLETYEFDNATGKFTFREVEFPEASAPNEPADFSQDNPKSCSACHRAIQRPSWEQWPKWPEAYFGKDTRADNSSVDAEDKKNIVKFMGSGAHKGRYKYLRGLDKYLDKDRQSRGDSANEFNQTVLNQVQILIAEEIKHHPRFQQLQYALYAAALGCPGIEDFVPDSERGDAAVTFEKIRKDTLLKNPKAGMRTMSLRFLFESYKLPTLHWSPSFRTKHTFRRGNDTPDDLNVMKELNERTGLGNATDPTPDICGVLKERSFNPPQP